jgi:hypothetical protein
VWSSINIAPPSAADASNDWSVCRSSRCPVTAPSPRRHRDADQAPQKSSVTGLLGVGEDEQVCTALKKTSASTCSFPVAAAEMIAPP